MSVTKCRATVGGNLHTGPGSDEEPGNRLARRLSDGLMDPEEHARIPSLVLPFALVGVAAVVFSLVGLTAFRVGPERVALGVALGTGGAVGAAVGALLRRWRSLHAPMVPRGLVTIRVGALVVAAGAAIGAVLGLQAWGEVGLVPFALGGAVAALAFVPACLTVLEAGRRAARARLGSVVASSDGRTIWATAFSAIAVISLAGVPALFAGCSAGRLSIPQQASLVLGVAAACVLGSFFLAWRDRVGIERVKRLRAEPLEEAAATTEASSRCVDVGLGDASWSTMGTAGTYRTATRGEVLLRGDAWQAVAAMERAGKTRDKAQMLAALSICVTLATCFASDLREVGADGCFRRVRSDPAGCHCEAKCHFAPVWPR